MLRHALGLNELLDRNPQTTKQESHMETIISAANALTWPGAIAICVIALAAAAVAWKLIDRLL
jgi:hypothetical protein